MSNENVTPEMSATALNQLYCSVFFDKLASYNLVPETQEDQYYLLGLAQKLPDQPATTKQANSIFALASQALDGVLPQQQPSLDDLAVKLAEHPYWQQNVVALLDTQQGE